MATFGDAIANIGAAALPDTDLIVARITPTGQILHDVAATIAGDEMGQDADTYLAGGAFASGSVSRHAGRKQENLRSILWLTLDADLTDYNGMDLPALHALPQAQIERFINAQRTDLQEVLQHLGIPVHRLDYTGYGLCAYIYLEPIAASDITTVRDAHKTIIAAINETARFQLVDPQVSDSGTRITRIPGSWNLKNPAQPRQVRTLSYQQGAQLTLDQLRFLVRRSESSGTTSQQPDEKVLPDAVLTDIVAAVKPHWTLGQKHILSLALAGMLARSGVPQPQTLAIIKTLSQGDAKPWDRERSVEDTYKRLQSGMATKGFTALKDILPAQTLSYIDGRLGQFRNASTGVFAYEVRERSTDKDQDRVATMKIAPIPSICFQGWVGDYVSMMLPLCEAPESFHLASGLGLIGASMGRKVSARYVSKSVYGNLYLMIVGVAGESRKDTAIEFAIGMPDHQSGRDFNKAPWKTLTDVGSPQGLMERLQKDPNIWLYVTEYERLAENAHRSSTSAIFPLLTTAWNTPVRLENVTKGSAIEANFPYLSVIAAVQPDVLEKHMLPTDITNGFASRWLYVPGEGRDPMADPPDIDELDAHDLYGRLLKTLDHYDGHRLRLADDAVERWKAWYTEDRARKVTTDDEGSIKSRLGVHIRKIALVYAASAKADEIALDHLNAAIAFVEWCWSHTQQLMKTWGVPMFNQIETRIEHVLQTRGPMKRRVLQKHCSSRKWSAVEFARVLDVMVKNGTIEHDAEGVHAFVK